MVDIYKKREFRNCLGFIREQKAEYEKEDIFETGRISDGTVPKALGRYRAFTGKCGAISTISITICKR